MKCLHVSQGWAKGRLANFAHLKAADSNQFQQADGIKTHTPTHTQTYGFQIFQFFKKYKSNFLTKIFHVSSSFKLLKHKVCDPEQVILQICFLIYKVSVIKVTNSERQTKTFTGYHFNICSTLPQVSS